MTGSIRSLFERCSLVGTLALLCGVLACCILTMNAGTAHALFTTEVHASNVHTVKAFPTGLSVDSDGYRAQSKDIDRAQLTVTATFSDGTSRVLDDDEYELSVEAFTSGYKGSLDNEATFIDTGHRVSAPFTVDADEAYGAQYGNVLVFGRGIPTDTYESKELKNTSWNIEQGNYSIRWNRNEIVKAVDIDTISPLNHMYGWFNDSTTLQQVSLTHVDTSRLTSLARVFHNCSALTRVDGISDWDVSHVTSLGFMFCNAASLTSVDLSRWNTVSVRDINCTFQNCSRLTSVGNLHGWNTSNMNQMGNTFQCCFALTNVGDLSSWNTSNVTWMKEMFQQCTVLANIGDVSGWNTSKVTNMYQMMQMSPKLVANCRNWNVSKVTDHTDFRGSSPNVISPTWS